MGPIIIAIAVVAVLFIIIISNIAVVQQSRAYVIERLGAFQSVWGVGLHFKVPFIDRIARKVSLKEQVLDYPPQPVITKDNVTMQIDTVVYFQITDPKLYAYGVEQPMAAMETLTATTLRNIIGDLELDQTLTSRDVVNTKMRAILDEATDPWGIKVNRVELKNILPPADIQSSMEKQMKAERDRRQAILQAEGSKKSAILLAEGERESAILRADAEKQAAILKAEAERESAILKAEGEAEAIRAVQQSVIKAMKDLQCEAVADNLGVYLFDENGNICALQDQTTATTFYPIPIRSLFIGDKTFGGLEAPDSNAISWSFLPNYSDDLAIVVPTDFNPLTDLVPAAQQ